MKSIVGLALVLWLIGCGGAPATPVTSATVVGDRPNSDLFMLLGQYTGRLRVEQGGIVRVYILREDGERIAFADAVDVTGYLQAENEFAGTPVTLKADPQPGDPPGQASEFKGDIPQSLRGKPLLASLNITVKGDRYQASFRSTPPSRSHEHQWMAAKGPKGESLKRLYLTAAGKYTTEDIKANGGIPAGAKYRGMMARHDMKPKPGDKLCPITDTKANPKFTWIIGGKTYEFCCPPCIDEFVQLAKEKPEEIKDPAEYVKK